MIDYARQFPLKYTLNKLIDKRIGDNSQSLGQFLPCIVNSINGSIVTVDFQNQYQTEQGSVSLPLVDMPVLGFEYIRYPIRVGDKGIAISCNVSLAGVSGLGATKTDFTNPGNLSAMVFVPIGNTNWSSFDANSLVLYSVNTGATVSVTPTEVDIKMGSTLFKVTSSGISITGNVSVTGTITATGDVTGNGTSLHTHRHNGVQTGSGNTGTPI